MKIYHYILFIFIIITNVYSDSNGIWYNAEDIRAGIFGDDENGNSNWTFNGNLKLNKDAFVMSKLGINTLNPKTELEVKGRVYITDFGTSLNSGAGLSMGFHPNISNGIALIQAINFSDTENKARNIIFQNLGGFVGVGIIPQTPLHVKSQLNNGKVLSLESNSPNIIFIEKTSEYTKNWHIGTNEKKFFIREDNLNISKERFSINENGNIGIGNVNPLEKLHVSGNIIANNIYSNGNLVATKKDIENLNSTINHLNNIILNQNEQITHLNNIILTQNDVIRIFSELNGLNPPKTKEECVAAGGTIMDDNGFNFCKFNGGRCPVTWNKYKDWTKTSPYQCKGEFEEICGKKVTSCKTEFHPEFDNIERETCEYFSFKYLEEDNICDGRITLCHARILEIGCY